MVDNKGILMIDAGNAFGFRKRNDSFYKDNFTFIDQYEFPNVNLDHYKCISINAFVDQVMLEKNKEKIAEYIRHQLDEDKLGDQMTMFGKDDDPFKGSK